MAPAKRKLLLTLHLISSLGWLGAVTAFLAVAIAGRMGTDPQLVRAAYLAMDLMGWAVILPFSLAALLTGIVQALGTVWGLFRHYWVLIKLIITSIATVLLLVHLQPVAHTARLAAAADLAPTDMTGMRNQLIIDAALAISALLVATVLSVYKPRGLTRRARMAAERQQAAAPRH